VLVYVKCSLEEAERRDPKGLYAAARAGNIDQFTGVNHPFQSPLNPEVTVDTENTTVDQCVEKVVNMLFKQELNNDVGGKYGFPLDKTREAEIVRFLRETDHLA
jgi:adenylylsulfate kinase